MERIKPSKPGSVEVAKPDDTNKAAADRPETNARKTRGILQNHDESRQTRGLESNHNESRARS